jgi:hypothetical protein
LQVIPTSRRSQDGGRSNNINHININNNNNVNNNININHININISPPRMHTPATVDMLAALHEIDEAVEQHHWQDAASHLLTALDEIDQEVDQHQWQDAASYLEVHLPDLHLPEGLVDGTPLGGRQTMLARRQTMLATPMLLECGLCFDAGVTAATTELFDCCGTTVCHDCVRTWLRWPHARSNAVCVACHEEAVVVAEEGTYHKNLRALGL